MNDFSNRGPLGQKVRRFVSAEWRKSARGKPCTLNLPGCDGGGETTVLCHLRLFSQAGIGQKSHDFCAVYGCANCHRLLDQDREAWGYDDVLRALLKTLDWHYREGRIEA